MTFEELSIKADVAKLEEDHPFYKYEYVVIDHLRSERDHPLEHSAMVSHWGLPVDDRDKYGGQLTVLNGVKNRAWHILLHYRYWNEVGINTEMVEELLLAHPEINLGDIPLPSIG